MTSRVDPAGTINWCTLTQILEQERAGGYGVCDPLRNEHNVPLYVESGENGNAWFRDAIPCLKT